MAETDRTALKISAAPRDVSLLDAGAVRFGGATDIEVHKCNWYNDL